MKRLLWLVLLSMATCSSRPVMADESPFMREFMAVREQAFLSSLSDEITREIGDATARRVKGIAADMYSTGYAISRGANEGNPLLGGATNSALMILGAQGLVLWAEYHLDRKDGNAWRECQLARFRNEAREDYGDCDRLGRIKTRSRAVMVSRYGLAAWNAYQAAQAKSAPVSVTVGPDGVAVGVTLGGPVQTVGTSSQMPRLRDAAVHRPPPSTQRGHAADRGRRRER